MRVTTLVAETTARDVPEGRHVIAVLDQSGDTRLVWDPENRDDVKTAKKMFDDLKAKGYVAYAVEQKEARGKVVTKFDPAAQKLIMTPPLRGG
jgi:hypothetical protein